MNKMYPTALLGSWGFNLSTEWLFLLLHTMHVGVVKTVQRYTVRCAELLVAALAFSSVTL